ncbi:hypothetical protein SAMN06265375_102228 [Muriicola jejuensis]|nr:hypothetical protein SAMN06265375_102228 [Muriicola jejuensis]
MVQNLSVDLFRSYLFSKLFFNLSLRRGNYGFFL